MTGDWHVIPNVLSIPHGISFPPYWRIKVVGEGNDSPVMEALKRESPDRQVQFEKLLRLLRLAQTPENPDISCPVISPFKCDDCHGTTIFKFHDRHTKWQGYFYAENESRTFEILLAFRGRAKKARSICRECRDFISKRKSGVAWAGEVRLD